MLKFLNIINIFGENYSMAMGVKHIWGNFDKTRTLASLKLNYFAQKEFRETVKAPEVFITISSAIYV